MGLGARYPALVTSANQTSSAPAWKGRVVSVLLFAAILAWIALISPVREYASGVAARGPTPGLEDEPFYPPSDTAVDATLAVARHTLTELAAEEPAVPEDAAEEPVSAEGAAEEPAAAEEPVAEAAPAPGFTGLDADRECLLSLYVPRGGGKAGPFVRMLSGEGPDRGAAEAAQLLYEDLPDGADSAEAIARSRLKLDCVIGEERAIPKDGGFRGLAVDQGLDGIVLRLKGQEPFRWLPSWTIEKPSARRHMHRSARRAARRMAGWGKAEAAKASVAAFRTRAYVESSPGGPVVPVVRGNTKGPDLEPSSIREAISIAGAYLARETDSRGKITYHYNDRKDTLEGGYNLLRHAGSTYSMLQAYRISGDAAVLAGSERAIGYFRRKMREDSKHPGEWFAVEGRRAKLGAIGLGLLMFVEHAKVAPDRAHDRELLRGMGRHIQRMQLPSGEFTSFYNWDGKERSTRKSIFYSGEAILGLVRLHQLTGEQQWLDVAVKGADFLVHDRWVALGIRLHIPPDAWLLQALVEMDRVAPDEGRADYAFALGKSIAQLKLLDAERTPPDLLGGEVAGIGSLPPTATAGSFGEALSAWARLEARRRPESTRAREVAEMNARFQLRHQLRTDNTWYLSNPARAHGGWRKRMTSGEVRNDHVQHNLSGLFGILPLYDESAPDIGLFVAETSP